MTYSKISITKALSAVVITCAVAAFHTAPVAAQNATGLNCGGCVKSKQLKNGGIKNKDLKDNAINSQKIADGTVGAADLAGDSVNSAKIADGAVTGADVQDNSLTGADVQDNSLTGADVQNNSLNSADVTLLNRGDIRDEAGVDTNFGNGATITSTPSSVIADGLTAPTNGTVTVIVTGTFQHNGTNTEAWCSIRNTNTTALDFANNVAATISATTDQVPFTVMRSFNQNFGTISYRLNCRIEAAAGSILIDDMNMAIMFYPTTY